jgi:hypothetical protein
MPDLTDILAFISMMIGGVAVSAALWLMFVTRPRRQKELADYRKVLEDYRAGLISRVTTGGPPLRSEEEQSALLAVLGMVMEIFPEQSLTELIQRAVDERFQRAMPRVSFTPNMRFISDRQLEECLLAYVGSHR